MKFSTEVFDVIANLLIAKREEIRKDKKLTANQKTRRTRILSEALQELDMVGTY